MKKIFIILFLISVISCENIKHRPYKERVCLDLLSKRRQSAYRNEVDAIRSIDSLFIRCGCDTLN